MKHIYLLIAFFVFSIQGMEKNYKNSLIYALEGYIQGKNDLATVETAYDLYIKNFKSNNILFGADSYIYENGSYKFGCIGLVIQSGNKDLIKFFSKKMVYSLVRCMFKDGKKYTPLETAEYFQHGEDVKNLIRAWKEESNQRDWVNVDLSDLKVDFYNDN
jgi:hypothetical protein